MENVMDKCKADLMPPNASCQQKKLLHSLAQILQEDFLARWCLKDSFCLTFKVFFTANTKANYVNQGQGIQKPPMFPAGLLIKVIHLSD